LRKGQIGQAVIRLEFRYLTSNWVLRREGTGQSYKVKLKLVCAGKTGSHHSTFFVKEKISTLHQP